MGKSLLSKGLKSVHVGDIVFVPYCSQYIVSVVDHIDSKDVSLRMGFKVNKGVIASLTYMRAILLLTTIPHTNFRIVKRCDASQYLVLRRDYRLELVNAAKASQIEPGKILFTLNKEGYILASCVLYKDSHFITTKNGVVKMSFCDANWSSDYNILEENERWLEEVRKC